MKFKVTRVIALSKEIEAETKEEALEFFSEHNAETQLVKETVKKIKAPATSDTNRVNGKWVDKWYDRKSQNWIIQLKDKEENQIGNAEIVGNKVDAQRTKEEMDRELFEEIK